MPSPAEILERTAHLATHLPLLASTAVSMLREDPALFAVQVVRRTPHRVRDRLGALPVPGSPDSVLRPLWLLMLDRTRDLHDTLDRHRERTSPLLDTIRVQVGAPLPVGATSRARARAAWAAGDIDDALTEARGTGHLEDQLTSETTVLTKGRGIVLGGSPPTTGAGTPSSEAQRPGTGRQLRVLHVLTNSLPWTQSGYALRSHAVLTSQQRAGLDVSAVTRLAYPVTIGRPWAAPVETIDGITYHRLLPARMPRLPDQRLLQHARMLADLAARVAPDILHTTTNFHNALVTDAVARFLGVPWVYEMRGELEKSWVARRPRGEQDLASRSRRYRLMRARETEMALRADAVVALSQVQRDSLIERGIPAARITVVPNAVDEELLERQIDRETARADLGLDDGFRVGTVSAIVDYEGLDTLLRALAFLRDQGTTVRASIVGDGVAREDLILLAGRLGLEGIVAFPGRVSPQEALRWYEALDVMVIPRRETPVTRAVTPIKGLQAMALGVPQVVSDLPALTEVATAHGQGIAVPPEDPQALATALRTLAEDPALCADMARRARAAARERTWSANAGRYLEMYQTVLGTRG